MDLDMQMSDPDFWNDPDKARDISQEATSLKTEVEGHEELVRRAADLMDFLEMAMENMKNASQEPKELTDDDLFQEMEIT